MDRFERSAFLRQLRQKSKIYIPIWIDLKACVPHETTATVAIYIPIWIDLKVNWFGECGKLIKNLHSNMDRFERWAADSNENSGITFTFQYG